MGYLWNTSDLYIAARKLMGTFDSQLNVVERDFLIGILPGGDQAAP